MDDTGRLQTLTRDENPLYYDLIQKFDELTNIPVILNTSFNLHGFPIVGTPEVAINTLENSDLDGLALGPFLVWRKDKPAPFERALCEHSGARASN